MSDPAAAGGVAARDAGPESAGAAPARAAVVLSSLIIVAAVANLNLAVANVALPDIAQAFDSSQTALNLIAVGYSLGLAASVLYFGALGDRYGRKTMLVLGMVLSIPACLLAAWAPSDDVLFLARVLGGLSAGMAYPTTLALITALWAGNGRTKAIARTRPRRRGRRRSTARDGPDRATMRGGGQQATVGPGAGRVPSGLDGMAAPLATHDARSWRLPQLPERA